MIFKLVIAKKDSIIYFNGLSGKHNYFNWFRKTFSLQNGLNPHQIKYESKGILVFFLLSLILLPFPLTKKKTTSEWGKKKMTQFKNLLISQWHQQFTITLK